MRHPRTRRVSGFTLVEIMIVGIIVAILAAVAVPSYLSSVQKGRRADAVDFAARVMQAQERFRANNTTYGTVANLSTYGISSSTSTGGYYGLAISGTSATGYTLTFSGSGSQAKDTGCTSLVVTMAAGTITKTPAACWSK